MRRTADFSVFVVWIDVSKSSSALFSDSFAHLMSVQVKYLNVIDELCHTHTCTILTRGAPIMLWPIIGWPIIGAK